MSEWLDLMLEEIDRKQQERREALDEVARRNGPDGIAADPSSHDAASGGVPQRQADR